MGKLSAWPHITEIWDLDAIRPKGGLFPVPAGVVYGTRNTNPFGMDTSEVLHGTTDEKIVITGLRDKSGWEASRANFMLTPTKNTALTAEEGTVSPYRENIIQGATIVPRFLFFVDEEEAKNKLGMSSGRVNVRSMRSPQEKEPWKSQEDLTGVVENRFVFDVHLGSTIAPFRQLEPWRAVLPIDQEELLNEGVIPDFERGLGEWWEQASMIWEANKSPSSKLSLRKQLNYQNKMSRQLRPTTHRVVYSSSGTRLAAARIDDPQLMIEHALYWLPVRSRHEALYLTAVLNASELLR